VQERPSYAVECHSWVEVLVMVLETLQPDAHIH